MVDNIAQHLIEFWRTGPCSIRPPASHEAVTHFESKYGVILSDDLRTYFLTVDGMDDDDLDPALNRFWRLASVKPVHEELGDKYSDRFAYPGCYLFADQLNWCFGWAVRLNATASTLSGPVFIVTAGYPPGPQIATSFAEFLTKYVDNPDSVQPPKASGLHE